MSTLYKNLRKADVQNAPPGYSPNAFITPISWLDTIADAVGSAALGNAVTIDESHVWAIEKGAIAIYCVPKTTEGNGEMVGDLLARRYAWKPKILLPGDNPELYDMVLGLINEDFLLHIKDASCGVNQYIQFGCNCDPVNVDTSTFTGGTTGEGRKQYEFNMLAYCKFFYNGVITELDDPA